VSCTFATVDATVESRRRLGQRNSELGSLSRLQLLSGSAVLHLILRLFADFTGAAAFVALVALVTLVALGSLVTI